MTIHRLSLLVRWFLIGSLLLLVLGVSLELIEYPTVVTTAGIQALVYLILFGLTILIYGVFALVHTRAITPAQYIALQQGTFYGLLCGGVWVIELMVANLLGPQWGWLHLVLYWSSTLTGYLLPGLASLFATWYARRIMSGLQAGLLCGMFGGLIIFLASLVLSALLLQAGQNDPQVIHEFQGSGLTDIRTYIVGDYLAGMITHLWIGLITGFFLGVLGGMLGKAVTTSRNMALEERVRKT